MQHLDSFQSGTPIVFQSRKTSTSGQIAIPTTPSYLLPRYRQLGWLRQKTASMGCAIILSLTGGWWLMGAIAPPAVHAYTGRLAVSLEVQPEETFEALTRRAEAVARAAAQRSFDRDILVTNVHIVISAEHLSRIVPILSLEVTRTQWSKLPDTRRWATYYSNAKNLLGFTPQPFHHGNNSSSRCCSSRCCPSSLYPFHSLCCPAPISRPHHHACPTIP